MDLNVEALLFILFLKEKPGARNFLKAFFDLKHVKDTLKVGFKKGPNNRRVKSILVFAAIFFIYGPGYGKSLNV